MRCTRSRASVSTASQKNRSLGCAFQLAQKVRQEHHERASSRRIGELVAQAQCMIAQTRRRCSRQYRLLQQEQRALPKSAQRSTEIAAVNRRYIMRRHRVQRARVVPVEEVPAIPRHLLPSNRRSAAANPKAGQGSNSQSRGQPDWRSRAIRDWSAKSRAPPAADPAAHCREPASDSLGKRDRQKIAKSAARRRAGMCVRAWKARRPGQRLIQPSDNSGATTHSEPTKATTEFKRSETEQEREPREDEK